MSVQNKAGKLNTGFNLLRPRSDMGGGLVVLLTRMIICVLSSYAVCRLLFCGFNIDCDYNVVNKAIFAAVIVFSAVQINLAVLIAGYSYGAIQLYKYAAENKEFLKEALKVIANESYRVISNALSLPTADGFGDIIVDTYTAVNTVSALIAAVIAAVMVLVVVRFCSKILYILGMAVLFAVLSFFKCEVNYKYCIVLLICFSFVIITGINKTRLLKINPLKPILNKRGIYRFNGGAMYAVQTAVIACVIAAAVNFGVNIFCGEDRFEEKFSDEYSENIRVTMRDISLMKYAEYKKYEVLNNVSMGQLGYAAYVKTDVNKNAFRFVREPISEGKLYFKAFVGKDYRYRYNEWTEDEINDSVMAQALENIGAASTEYEIYSGKYRNLCVPYYADMTNKSYDEDNKMEVTAYEYEYVEINDEEYNNFVESNFLSIDDENRAVIEKICSDEGFSKDDENLEDKLKEYFENNFTYSTETVVLPYGKDFVNYFLEETKTGNYIQYASAITLIYRNLGIPARYVSGYAVEAEQTLAGKRVGNTTETNTQVKSANFYSWVEIYDKNGGWQIVDIVNAPSMEELDEMYGEEAENTYTPDTSLESYFSTVDKEKYTPENIAKAGAKTAVKLLRVIAIAAVMIFILFVLGILMYRFAVFCLSDNSKKAYIIMERLKKKYKVKNGSYRELEKRIAKKYGNEKAMKIVNLGERCIFSERVSGQDVKKLIRLIFHK